MNRSGSISARSDTARARDTLRPPEVFKMKSKGNQKHGGQRDGAGRPRGRSGLYVPLPDGLRERLAERAAVESQRDELGRVKAPRFLAAELIKEGLERRAAADPV